MKYLIVCILWVGCGVDPDDFKAEKSDGCPSGGCELVETPPQRAPEIVEEETESATQTTTNTVEVVPTCTEGKICRGMTMEEVLALLGEPNRIQGNTWYWEEQGGDTYVCNERETHHILTNYCQITFRSNKVTSQREIKAEWIDLINF
jgi:hypothetical protein